MSKTKVIDGIRYHADRPDSCRACYFCSFLETAKNRLKELHDTPNTQRYTDEQG